MLKRHAQSIETLCQNIMLKYWLHAETSCLKHRWYAQNTETTNAQNTEMRNAHIYYAQKQKYSYM